MTAPFDQHVTFLYAEDPEPSWAFYEQVLTEGYWNKYKRISVKYKNQVIAKKNR